VSCLTFWKKPGTDWEYPSDEPWWQDRQAARFLYRGELAGKGKLTSRSEPWLEFNQHWNKLSHRERQVHIKRAHDRRKFYEGEH
jgi:hypothetical protein